MTPDIRALPDDGLVAAMKAAAASERRATAQTIALLAEFDDRRLYLRQGCSSLFVYCTRVLHLSEHAAYGRIEAARLARRFPAVVDRLAAGDLTLTAACLLRPVLTADNQAELLDAARHKSRRQVEAIVASVRPQPPAATIIRKVPAREAASRPSAASQAAATTAPLIPSSPAVATRLAADLGAPRPPVPHRPVVAPLSPETYRLQVTLTRDTHDKLRLAQDLLRHSIPNGDPAAVLDRALTLLVDHLAKRKLGATTRPRASRASDPGSRRIPNAVRRAVWARDGGQCAFAGAEGRCQERGLLEFHHVVPYADGGAATVDGIRLRCRAHNQYEAVLWDGGGGWVRETLAEYR
jgi:hypothetical protein